MLSTIIFLICLIVLKFLLPHKAMHKYTTRSLQYPNMPSNMQAYFVTHLQSTRRVATESIAIIKILLCLQRYTLTPCLVLRPNTFKSCLISDCHIYSSCLDTSSIKVHKHTIKIQSRFTTNARASSSYIYISTNTSP